jgi:hypothetical protein
MTALLGVHLTMLIGPTVAVPAPLPLTECLDEVKVTHSDSGRSGFQLTFKVGRGGLADLVDYPLLTLPLLRAYNRVVLIATFSVMPRVLMDGVITRQELQPGTEPGEGRLTVTGEDVSLMMDLEEKSQEHPAQDETIIANVLIASYAQYGLIPVVIPPISLDPPVPIERVPVQQGTDLDYLQQMAQRYGYVFYVSPGPAPMTNTAYWGPPPRTGLPQSAITVNMGGQTNATIGAFQTNHLGPQTVSGQVQDRTTGQTMPVRTFAPLRTPLVSQPSWLVNQPNVRSAQFRETGLSTMQAYGRAQGQTDETSDSVSVEGELDTGAYGDMLQARSIVGLRGAGYQHDGLWYVKEVKHELKPGSYKQGFTLTREGHGSVTPVVIP